MASADTSHPPGTVSRLLDTHLPTPWIVGAGLAVGLAIALSTLDVGFILGSSEYWEIPQDDAAQHLAGLLAFVGDRWHFPLLAIEGFGEPEGANAANLDVIPLLAVVDKLQYPVTGRAFLYLGVWVALCRVLQAMLTALLLAELGERRPVPIIAVSVLASGLPSLLERTLHEALSSQFLLLAGLLAYLRIVRAPSLAKPAIATGVLLAASLLIHPYLLAMLCPLYLAALAERVHRGRLSTGRLTSLIALQASGLLLLMLACGHLGAVEPRAMEPGSWRMNLISPIVSSESRLLPTASLLPDARAVLAPEGTNYLGLGVLALLGTAMAVAPGAVLRPLRRHLFLCAALLCLTLFSLSNRVFFARTLVLSYLLPAPLERLASLFPGRARFFWPVALALVVWLVVSVSRRFSAPGAAALLAMACGVQWIDLAGARARSFDDTARHREDPLGRGRPAWVALVARQRAIEILPSYECREPALDGEFDLQLELIAVRAGVPVNSAYLARPNKDCAREAERERRSLHERPPLGALRIFYRHAGGTAPDASGDPKSCRPFDRGVVCTQAWTDAANARWAALLRSED